MMVAVSAGRRSMGNHWLKALKLAIKQAETPNPISARPRANACKWVTRANRVQPLAATSNRAASTRRGPKRSNNRPSGNWNSPNPKK